MNNAYLEECNGSADLAGRLQQLFLDADDFLSDIDVELQFALLERENASDNELPAIDQTLNVLRMARSKVGNIVHDFKIHYVLTAPNQTQAGLDQLILAADNYKQV